MNPAPALRQLPDKRAMEERVSGCNRAVDWRDFNSLARASGRGIDAR